MKGLLFFLGGLTAAAILIAAAVLAFRRAIRRFSSKRRLSYKLSGIEQLVSLLPASSIRYHDRLPRS